MRGRCAPMTRLKEQAAQAVRRWGRSLRERGAKTVAAARNTRGWRRAALFSGGAVGGVLVGLILLVTFMDWNVMRGPVASFASATLDRRVVIGGDLDVDLWSRRALVHDLHVSGPDWADECETIVIERAFARVRLLPLLSGRWVFDEVDLFRPAFCFKRESDGRATWQFRKAENRRPMNLPAVTRFRIREGSLRIDDRRRKLIFAGGLMAADHGGGAPEAFKLEGEGKLNGEIFRAVAWGPPLVAVSRSRPYPFRADFTAGGTHIVATGAFDRPFDFAAFGASIEGTGPDLALLYPLIGVTLPNTPPYRLHMNFRRDGPISRLNDLRGTVGDSDLAGLIVVDRRRPRTLLTADLTSRSLDFDDLAVVLGGAPDASETASAGQRTHAARLNATNRLLPDAKLDLDRVRRMDARLKYRARSVKTRYLPLRRFAMDMTLQDAVITARPLAFSLPRGDIAGVVRIDARQDTPDVDVDLNLTRARIEDLMAKSPQPNAMAGPLEGRLKLRGRGRSVREAAATADGRAMFVSRDGAIREAFAELLGINVVKGLGLLLTRDHSETPVRCAVASFDARNGVLHGRTIVLDTGPVLALGKGQIDLRTEAIDIQLRGKPKEPRLIRLMAPVRVGGHLAHPSVGVELDDAAGQGAAAALAAFFAPVASILPFVTLDLAKDADCGAVVKLAQASYNTAFTSR